MSRSFTLASLLLMFSISRSVSVEGKVSEKVMQLSKIPYIVSIPFHQASLYASVSQKLKAASVSDITCTIVL